MDIVSACSELSAVASVFSMNMGALNALPEDIAVGELLRCGGSTRWAREMAAARPFVSFDAAAAAADRIWDKVTPADWLEARARRQA